MTDEEAIKIIKAAMETMYLPKSKSYISDFGYALEWLIQRHEEKWIPVKFRKATEEEKRQYEEYGIHDIEECWDCPLPDDGQEVLVSTAWGVDKDTFYIDSYYGMGFENYDSEDVDAWMPLPESYKVGDTDGKDADNG